MGKFEKSQIFSIPSQVQNNLNFPVQESLNNHDLTCIYPCSVATQQVRKKGMKKSGFVRLFSG